MLSVMPICRKLTAALKWKHYFFIWRTPREVSARHILYLRVLCEPGRALDRFSSPISIVQIVRQESQNHRIVGVGRDLCGSPSPTLLPKQGHPEQAAQDLVQVGLEYLQRRRLHNLPGQPVPVLRHPQREEVLPQVQLELPMLQFVPVVPCPVTGHH